MGSEKNRIDRTSTAVTPRSSTALELAKTAASNPLVRKGAVLAIGVGLGAACKYASSPVLVAACEASVTLFHLMKELL